MQNNDQPMPTKTDEPFTHDLVAKDVEARKQLGIKKYGVALQPNNGRDSLQDAYEECLDLVVYLRNQIAKNASEGSDAAELAVMRGRYNAALSGIVKQNEELAKLRANPTQDRIIASQSAALVKASEDVERLKRDNERLSTQLNNLNQLNLALREERKWPSGFWNVINQAFLKGWEWRSLNRPEDVTKKLQEARHAIRVIFYQEKFPEE